MKIKTRMFAGLRSGIGNIFVKFGINWEIRNRGALVNQTIYHSEKMHHVTFEHSLDISGERRQASRNFKFGVNNASVKMYIRFSQTIR